ncbi:hypothetical protein J3U99_20780 [Brucella pituitosa]|uniref:hypothetical protein n=1 Tax=Brucella pituitosa TaxID=571256 RepID=UPI0020030B9D|nr:hypothetical protein [Brucella pituitosa]MCK4207206.1 hypothetical protein [Brucella pituitosa]
MKKVEVFEAEDGSIFKNMADAYGINLRLALKDHRDLFDPCTFDCRAMVSLSEVIAPVLNAYLADQARDGKGSVSYEQRLDAAASILTSFDIERDASYDTVIEIVSAFLGTPTS